MNFSLKRFCSLGSCPETFQSTDRGVTQSPDDEHPVPAVGSSDVSSTHHERRAGVPAFLQRSEHFIRAPSAESRDVLKQYPTGSHLRHDPQKLPKQT